MRLTPYKVQTYNLETFEKTSPEIMTVNWNLDAAMKNGFPHFMLKEIHEQPEAMKNTILPRLNRGIPDFSDDRIPDSLFAECSQVHIVACGTACLLYTSKQAGIGKLSNGIGGKSSGSGGYAVKKGAQPGDVFRGF